MPIIIDKRVKKKNGISRYRVIVNYTDTNGKHTKVERLVWGRAEAQLMERKLEDEFRNKQTPLAARLTFGELFEKYEQYHAMQTRRSSHESSMKTLRLRVLPYFNKDLKIDRLTPSILNDWKLALDKTGNNLSLTTKQNAYAAFAAMLNYAVKMEFIPKNNLSVIGNFKDSAALDTTSEQLHYYTAEQFTKFIAVAKTDCKTITDWGFYVFFNIAFFTGARKGEINALKWSDIEGNILHIRRSITQKLKGGDVETLPKNKSSIRDLQMPEPLIAILAEHKERQRNAASIHFTDDFRVCGGMQPLRDTSIDKHNRKYAEAAGLPHIKVHDFRHSHVSLLANEGINIQEVARRLGHSNVQETWGTYCHLYPREEERAVEVLNKIQID